jgi:hypothetical protein
MEGNDFRVKRVDDAEHLTRKWLGGKTFEATLGLAPAGEKGSYAASLTELADDPKVGLYALNAVDT